MAAATYLWLLINSVNLTRSCMPVVLSMVAVQFWLPAQAITGLFAGMVWRQYRYTKNGKDSRDFLWLVPQVVIRAPLGVIGYTASIQVLFSGLTYWGPYSFPPSITRWGVGVCRMTTQYHVVCPHASSAYVQSTVSSGYFLRTQNQGQET